MQLWSIKQDKCFLDLREHSKVLFFFFFCKFLLSYNRFKWVCLFGTYYPSQLYEGNIHYQMEPHRTWHKPSKSTVGLGKVSAFMKLCSVHIGFLVWNLQHGCRVHIHSVFVDNHLLEVLYWFWIISCAISSLEFHSWRSELAFLYLLYCCCFSILLSPILES